MASFEGLKIVLSGIFLGHKHDELRERIIEAGGSVAGNVTAKTTHLVLSQTEHNNKGPKYIVARKFPIVHVVTIDWLLDSLAGGQKLDETPYHFRPKTTDDADASKLSQIPTKATGEGANKKRSHPVEKAVAVEESSPPIQKQSRVDNDQKDRQLAKSRSLVIPVEEGCSLAGSHRVYIDNTGRIYDVTLNQTNASNNNNKFYRIQLLEHPMAADYRVWCRWGRVGETGQGMTLGDGELEDALKQFNKKFKDKNGNTWQNRGTPARPGKYTLIERNYENDSSSDDDFPGAANRRASKEGLESQTQKQAVESKLPKSVQRLLSLIFNQHYFEQTMMEMDHDANKLPLGKLSKKTLRDGYKALKDLAALVNHQSFAATIENKQSIEDISNKYLSLIPHAFGRRKTPIINTPDAIKREIDLLETLADMEIANEIMQDAKQAGESASPTTDPTHYLDRQFAGLGLEEMTPLDIGSNEYRQLQEYLMRSHGATHALRYNLQDIFRVSRRGEPDRISHFANSTSSDRRLLWHGSRCTNFGGILSQGLRIAPPEAPVSGYMFGKGVYLADVSSKSANYCASYTSGNIGLLLLCEAELGKPMLELERAEYNAGEIARQKGCIAAWGMGMTVPTGEWKDAGCVHGTLTGVKMPDFGDGKGVADIGRGEYLQYNEYIVYDVAQIRLRYLLRVEMI